MINICNLNNNKEVEEKDQMNRATVISVLAAVVVILAHIHYAESQLVLSAVKITFSSQNILSCQAKGPSFYGEFKAGETSVLSTAGAHSHLYGTVNWVCTTIENVQGSISLTYKIGMGCDLETVGAVDGLRADTTTVHCQGSRGEFSVVMYPIHLPPTPAPTTVPTVPPACRPRPATWSTDVTAALGQWLLQQDQALNHLSEVQALPVHVAAADVLPITTASSGAIPASVTLQCPPSYAVTGIKTTCDTVTADCTQLICNVPRGVPAALTTCEFVPIQSMATTGWRKCRGDKPYLAGLTFDATCSQDGWFNCISDMVCCGMANTSGSAFTSAVGTGINVVSVPENIRPPPSYTDNQVYVCEEQSTYFGGAQGTTCLENSSEMRFAHGLKKESSRDRVQSWTDLGAVEYCGYFPVA